MADLLGEHTNGSSSSSSGGAKSKADKRKQTILVITGVVGVLLTYLLWRHSTGSSSGSTAQDYTPSTGGTQADNGGGASSPDYSGAMNAIGGQLTTLQAQLATDESGYASQEEAFNAKIGTLTKKLAHDTTTIQHLEHSKAQQGAQIHHQALVMQSHEQETKKLEKQTVGHHLKAPVVKKTTAKTKKKA